jgi:nitrate reductase NapE component
MTPAKFAVIKIFISVVLALAVVGVVAYGFYIGKYDFRFGKPGKLSTAISPARDLTGTWISSLRGKGLQLSGQFNTAGTVTTVYEEGDIELIINEVKDNIAYGTFRYLNLCSWGFSIVPELGRINVPRQCVNDSGQQPIQIKVSSSGLDFGTVTASGVTATMTGTFTTDLIHGTMTATVAPFGQLKGLFNLNRQR